MSRTIDPSSERVKIARATVANFFSTVERSNQAGLEMTRQLCGLLGETQGDEPLYMRLQAIVEEMNLVHASFVKIIALSQ